jgi:alkyl hydroperoxide reductase subunit AhpC
MLVVGERAPDFKVASTGGKEVQLYEKVREHPATILAFYVLDFTPG